MSERLLPVHGFVLAGGKSSRMGVDKALLEFGGRPLVQIAVEKLRGFCAEVSICGNRDDLSGFAPVVRETRLDAGPAAGIEAGLMAARQPWCLFVPVDVPLVPGELLRRWAEDVMALNAKYEDGIGGSYLRVDSRVQPVFCMLNPYGVEAWVQILDTGERRLEELLTKYRVPGAGTPWVRDAESYDISDGAPVEYCFQNLNTPQEFDEAEFSAGSLGE